MGATSVGASWAGADFAITMLWSMAFDSIGIGGITAQDEAEGEVATAPARDLRRP